jgi:hypothetical protein
MRLKAKRTSTLDVDEVDVVSSGMHHGPKCHGVCHLSMEPDVFIGREQPRKLGTNDTNDVAKHREKDETTVVGENEASTARSPDREPETVQSGEFLVCCL